MAVDTLQVPSAQPVPELPDRAKLVSGTAYTRYLIINLDVLGLPEHSTMAMRFVDDQMLVTFSELLGGQKVQLSASSGK